MNGIMSGITDREDYQDDSTAERLIAAAGEPGGMDPLTQFLIQGGLNLAAGPAILSCSISFLISISSPRSLSFLFSASLSSKDLNNCAVGSFAAVAISCITLPVAGPAARFNPP